MATRHRYTFEGCGHSANATNEQFLSNLTVHKYVESDGQGVTVRARLCPKCAKRVAMHIRKCMGRA